MSENAFLPQYTLSRSAKVASRILVATLALGMAFGVYAQPLPAPARTAANIPSNSQAIAGQSVKIALTQMKVVKTPDGKEVLEDASKVKPGDILEYRATYTNVSGKAVSGLVADLPIPEGLAYIPRSAKPSVELVKAATINGEFAVEPLARKVDGKSVPIPYTEYRKLRWNLGQLPAGGVTAVSARAQVETVEPVLPKLQSGEKAAAAAIGAKPSAH